MKHKNAKLRLLPAKLGPRRLDVLLQLLDRVLERRARVVHLVDDQDPLAHQAAHLAQRAEVQPLRARHSLAGLLDVGVGVVRVGGELLVERQADRLDRDVGAAGALEERPQDPRGHVAAAADGDDQLRVERLEELGGGLLAEFVDLEEGGGEGLGGLFGLVVLEEGGSSHHCT